MLRPRSVPGAAVAVLAAMTLAACTNNPVAAPTSSATAAATGQGSPPSNAPELEKDYVSVVAQVLPSVVQITTGSGLGSGVLLDDKGDIVTNAHVVGTATTFQVRLANNPTTFPATLVGAYPPDDLAVIRLDQPSTGLKPARFGDSSKLQIGDIVLAMGNPLGLTGSVTDGIVSAVGRAVTEPASDGSPGATLPQAIQTSAAINPGNSGGALVDLSASVIGVPTLAAISPQTGGSAAPGIGFAIPSNVVTDIAGQLVANGGHVPNSRRAALGIGAVTVVDQNGQPTGVAVGSVVPGGPAAAAGIKPGEVITAVNNTPVQSSAELSEVLAGLSPGQAVPVTVVDPQGKTTSVTVTLGQLPGS
jgi:S1-C subfamily serine protease